MAKGVYTVQFTGVAVTAAQDFFEITPADDKPVEIIGLFLSQYSDAGDAQDELLSYSIVRGHATSGSGGTAPTPQLTHPTDAAAGFTAEVNNTTIASAGTGVTLHSDSFNVRAGLAVWFPPEAYHMATQANTTIVVRLLGAPGDSLTMSGTLYVKEH